MNQELQTTSDKSGASIIPTGGDNFELSATNPIEMVQCHQTAMEWCRRKIELVGNEARELKLAYEHAKKSKWSWQTLKKHWDLSECRVVFYQKMLAAFEAGYYIVPNFPAAVFAIRTDRNNPKTDIRIGYTYEPRMTQEITNPMPQGEGEYVNPEPTVKQASRQLEDGTKRTVKDYWADKWQEMDFPANMARLHVMESATRAMALKIFDEILMLPSDKKRHADPILIGTIVCKTKSPYKNYWKRASFMIGWHIDTKTL